MFNLLGPLFDNLCHRTLPPLSFPQLSLTHSQAEAKCRMSHPTPSVDTAPHCWVRILATHDGKGEIHNIPDACFRCDPFNCYELVFGFPASSHEVERGGSDG